MFRETGKTNRTDVSFLEASCAIRLFYAFIKVLLSSVRILGASVE